MYQESRNIMVKKLLKGILITGVMVMGISGCSSNVQDDSKQKIVSIQKMDKSFKSEKREEKLDTLKKVLKSQSKYLKEENQDNNVLDQYKKTVTKMRKYFISDYEKNIKENTLENVESIQDKQQINEKKDNLNALKTLVSEEYKFTLDSKKQYDSYMKSITEIVTQYDDRIAVLEKEEEMQKQAEIEKQKEAQRTYSNEFFTITVPEEWGSNWSIQEDTSSTKVLDGITRLRAFYCSYMPNTPYPAGGGAYIYVLNMSDYGIDEEHRSLAFYRNLIPVPEDQQQYLYSPDGETSQGWAVFVENVAASFIDDGARHTVPLATITLN
jgi:myosin heavy subunit